MNLLGRIGKGIRTAGKLLPVLAMGLAAQNAYSQAFVPIPGVKIGRGHDAMQMGIYIGPDGPQTTLSGNGGYVMLPPIKGNDSSQQQNQQQGQQYVKKIKFGVPILWRDDNCDLKMQPNEIVKGEPKIGVRYYVALDLKNAAGVTVRVNIDGVPEKKIVAETDHDLIRQSARFNGTKPVTIRFDVPTGNSWRRFFPEE